MTRKLILLLALGLASMTPSLLVAQPGRGAERHPHIHGAIRELREARRELETAAHDFGGHRREAIGAVDNAIRQLQEALAYDRK